MYQVAIFWDSIEANKWLANFNSEVGYEIVDIEHSTATEGGISQCCIMVVYKTMRDDSK